jgi:hypothetical protein
LLSDDTLSVAKTAPFNAMNGADIAAEYSLETHEEDESR